MALWAASTSRGLPPNGSTFFTLPSDATTATTFTVPPRFILRARSGYRGAIFRIKFPGSVVRRRLTLRRSEESTTQYSQDYDDSVPYPHRGVPEKRVCGANELLGFGAEFAL